MYRQWSKCRRIQWLATSWLAAAFVSACGKPLPNFSILPTSQGAYQSDSANNKVDILWVVDNSGSMLTKQQNLSTNFDYFSQIFLSKDFDFRMAIVTTDTRSILAGGQASIFQGTPNVLSTSIANWSNSFKSNIVVGAGGDAQAKAIDAIENALSEPTLSNYNSGFLRDDAHLAIIAVSDADDNDSSTTPSQLLSFLGTLKPDVVDVTTHASKKNFTFHSVVVDTSDSHNTTCPLPYEDGIKFKWLSAQTDGTLASICEANFASGLTNLSKKIAEAITQIPLARVPDISTLQVSFSGPTIPNDSSNGWTYDSDKNRVLFHGSYIPSTGTSISIYYIPNDIIR